MCMEYHLVRSSMAKCHVWMECHVYVLSHPRGQEGKGVYRVVGQRSGGR